MTAPAARASSPRLTGRDYFVLIFGLFLGLAILKFGNPVILESKIAAPRSLSEAWTVSWPIHWANAGLFVLLLAGGGLALTIRQRWPASRWLWLLPLVWLGWQGVSATQSVDGTLTSVTLIHFAGCVGCYFVGAILVVGENRHRWLLLGLLAALAFCLVRGVNQRLIEFPGDRQLLTEGERTGWTNFAPEVFSAMKAENLIITTNGVDVANPAILQKLTKGRIHGTLVYPNALAGILLLLGPVALALAFGATRQMRPVTRAAVIGLTVFLCAAVLFWTGSKSGWLIALGLGGLWLLRLNWPARWKWASVILMLVLGLGVFALRFQTYFAAGATSVGARFDYWRAAVKTTTANPVFGSGPGTFQRPYARLKAPDSEMARLTHNDYLEQFSDSGVIGGISYLAWISLLLWTVGRRAWAESDPVRLALFVGLLGWFAQGFSEFGLYVPALAWTAFTLAGAMISADRNPAPQNA